MLKISMKTFGLPYTTGTLYKPTATDSSASYETEGTEITEIYKDETNGIIGGEMLGVVRRFSIPYRVMGTVTIDRNNILEVDGRRYEIIDVRYMDLAYIEDYFALSVEEKNS